MKWSLKYFCSSKLICPRHSISGFHRSVLVYIFSTDSNSNLNIRNISVSVFRVRSLSVSMLCQFVSLNVMPGTKQSECARNLTWVFCKSVSETLPGRSANLWNTPVHKFLFLPFYRYLNTLYILKTSQSDMFYHVHSFTRTLHMDKTWAVTLIQAYCCGPSLSW